MSRYSTFLNQLKKLVKVILFGLFMFSVLRIIFVCRFGNIQTFKSFLSDIPFMILYGVISDLQIITYILSPVLFLSFVPLIIKSDNVIEKLSKIIIIAFYTIAVTITITNHQYYSFFKLNFNSVLFDFFDEEPKLLLKSVWIEHPVILLMISLLVAFVIIRKIIKDIYSNTKVKEQKGKKASSILVIVTFIGFYFLAMRGSMGTFPLQKHDLIVSENEFINTCVPNPLYSLKEAHAEVKREFYYAEPEQTIRNQGFNSLPEALSVYFDLPIDSVKNRNLDDFIFTKSYINEIQKKYNVVYLVMESMSNLFISYHSRECNLLGSLEPHLKEDILFRNFQSSHNGTIASLERIILNVPYNSVFDSKFRFKSYDLSIAKPFREAGYITNFTTGIKSEWRNIGQSLKRQYFDQVYGKHSIMKSFPSAQSNNTWGVYDHSMLDYIFSQLMNNDTAMFILSLSSTNHTPFELPNQYLPYEINLSLLENSEFSGENENIERVLTAYQYSNDAVGKFINKIKSSRLAQNTIVIVTGDHNNKSVISYNTQELMRYKYSVPFYLYVPDDLKTKLFVDTSRWGSHYDIMTSVFPYILYDIKYPCLGQNLFSEEIPSNQFYSINTEQILHDQSMDESIIRRKARARAAIVHYYYSTQFHQVTDSIRHE